MSKMESLWLNSKGKLRRFFSKLLIVMQLYPIIAPSVLAGAGNIEETNIVIPFSSEAQRFADSTATNGINGIKNTATSMATGAAVTTVEEWLSYFGTAQINLNVDNDGHWDNSSFDFLTPVYENEKSTLFAQIGLRAPDGRTTGNVGVGVRTFYTQKWMFGGNVFFDNDFTGKNRRVGFGAEAWTDYLKLSANTYVGTTEWHSSRDFDNYHEKPADGFDIRMENYFPACPQLGLKAMYEEYYGDKVALFDKDHLQSNPSAVTVGLNYTPIPLITAALDYKRGQDSLDETKVSLNLHYTLDQSWQSQISPDQVALRRSLAGNRNDIVNRNNEIILQYKKKETSAVLADMVLTTIKDNSPADGDKTNTVTLHAVTSDGKSVANASIVWSVTGTAKLNMTTGITDANGNASVNLSNTTAEQVIVSATSETITRHTTSSFTQSVAALDLSLTKNNSKADGLDQNVGLATLTDTSGKPIAGIPVTWTTGNGAKIVSSDTSTDSKGHATIHFSSATAGTVKLSASAGGKKESVNSVFTDQIVNNVAVSMSTNNASANGTTANIAQALITDADNHSMEGVSVNWSLNSSTAAMLTPQVAVTNSKGIATLNLADNVAEDVTVTASAGNRSEHTVATFIADGATAHVSALTIDKDGSVADGVAQNHATATVTDSGNNILANTVVTWSITGSAGLTSVSSTTNASGQAKMTFTDTHAETVTLTAKSGGTDNGQSKTSSFVANAATAHVSSLTIDDDNHTANGTAQNRATATVTDANGNIISGSTVDWNVGGSATLSATTSQSDANGKAIVSLTDVVAETVNLSARVGSTAEKTQATTFIADAATAHVSALTIDKDGSVADGVAQNHATATVTDSGNNILANTVVTWSITGSAGLTSVSSTTNASGQAEMTFTDTHAETVTLTAKSGGADNGQSKTSSFVANTATAHVSSLTIDDDNHTANGTAQNSATATVTDANGNIVSGSTVDWNVGGNATLSATTSQSDANGKAIVSLTDVVAETVNLSARVGNTMPQVQKTTFTFIVDHLTMTMLVDGHGGLGSSTPNVVKVTAYDVNNDPMPGVALSLRDNDLSITTTFNPSKGKTGADGSLTSDVFSNTLGVLLLVAEVTNSDVPTTAGKTSVNATFTSRD